MNTPALARRVALVATLMILACGAAVALPAGLLRQVQPEQAGVGVSV